jgi:hypothetical protein
MRHCPFRQDIREPWEYSADKSVDLQAWITACKDYFQCNAWQCGLEKDGIEYTIGLFKEPSRAQDFGAQYH